MSKFYQYGITRLIADLAKQGERIVKECLEERTYNHDTYNLHDSYGYGIFLKGKLVKYYTPTPVAEEPKKWYNTQLEGHEEIMRFLNEYKASQGIELVIAAAMPYAEVLENASGGQKRKYKVISMAFDKLNVLSQANPGLKSHVSAIIRAQKQSI